MKTKLIAALVAVLSLGAAFQLAPVAQAAESPTLFPLEGQYVDCGDFSLSWDEPSDDVWYYEVLHINARGAETVAVTKATEVTISGETDDQTFRVLAIGSRGNEVVARSQLARVTKTTSEAGDPCNDIPREHRNELP